MEHPAKKRRFAYWLIVVVLVFALLAGGRYVGNLLLILYGKAGMVNPPPEVSTPLEGSFIISCFGDDFTQGIGAVPGRDYPAQLEKLLRNADPELNIRVLNEGVSGYNSSELLNYLQTRSRRYPVAPRIFIISTFGNNFWNLHQSTMLLENYNELFSNKKWIEKISGLPVGRLAILLFGRGKSLARRLASIRDWNLVKDSIDFSNPNPSEIIDVGDPGERSLLQQWIKDDMSRIASIVQGMQARVLFTDYFCSYTNELIATSSADLNLSFCPLQGSCAEWKSRGWVCPDSLHPNDQGYAAMAARIAQCLDEKGFLPVKTAEQ